MNGTACTAAAEMSFYDLLGIPESVSLRDIKMGYKQLARKYHPDVSLPDRVEEYTQRFIRVQEAYETLSDPRQRALYDRDMARGLHLAFSARRRSSHHDDEIILSSILSPPVSCFSISGFGEFWGDWELGEHTSFLCQVSSFGTEFGSFRIRLLLIYFWYQFPCSVYSFNRRSKDLCF
ncbi:unnamed protein product [Linum trigynum]|uniref:J domain-containing protein n=1 Tax=Linum trigynum TaxID=586398 RepID=A0AAV2GNF6_9ROSI